MEGTILLAVKRHAMLQKDKISSVYMHTYIHVYNSYIYRIYIDHIYACLYIWSLHGNGVILEWSHYGKQTNKQNGGRGKDADDVHISRGVHLPKYTQNTAQTNVFAHRWSVFHCQICGHYIYSYCIVFCVVFYYCNLYGARGVQRDCISMNESDWLFGQISHVANLFDWLSRCEKPLS